MALPRSAYVQEGQEGVYHCFSRCVRRAFLCGFDPLTGRDFSHRKAMLLERLQFLASLLAIEVCAYAIMVNHWHAILRTRPDIAASWSALEVAFRWLTFCPRRRGAKSRPSAPSDEEIRALAGQPERIAELRRRLSSLSWFMGKTNEFIARAANKEDHVKGRFWEGRFKCQVLLDEAATAGCMVYVDLNLIRAGAAASPEESDFTSIQERICAWKKQTMAAISVPDDLGKHDIRSLSAARTTAPENVITAPDCMRDRLSNPSPASSGWLCPIASEPSRRGILAMTTAEYFDLVDRTGRMVRLDKTGSIDPNIAPILLRIGAKPDAWIDTTSHFGEKFRLAAGQFPTLQALANRLSRRWLHGVAVARTAFTSSLPSSA